ncbi:leucine-rich repeat protein [Ceratobasidium sp. AG-Ba]|nr:leucine-rich repeat protein [Ceratobasidium sp. AG-Ba]
MSARIVQLPELIEQIYIEAAFSTTLPLMLTCRGFFDALVPLAWKAVIGCEQILSLIEGTLVAKEGLTVSITLPVEIKEGRLARLAVYAPYVRRLEVFRHSGFAYKLTSWDTVLEHSWATALLPNLRTLTLSNGLWCTPRLPASLPLMLLFISPSLLDYHVTRMSILNEVTIPEPRARAVLLELQRRCPNIQTLVLFSRTTELCVHEEERRLIPMDHDCPNLLQFARLRVLPVTFSRLDFSPAMTICSAEEIKIHAQEFVELFIDKRLQWPKLNILSVYSVQFIHLLDPVWDTPALATKLTHIFIQFDYFYFKFRPNCFFKRLIALLAGGCPNLKILNLHQTVPPSAIRPVDPDFLFQALSNLNLIEFRSNIPFSDSVQSRHTQEFLQDSTFASLKHLDLKRYRINLSDFRFYARSMPGLQYLRIKVFISTSNLEPEETYSHMDRCNFELHLDDARFEKDPDELTWYTCSRFLLNLWPNITLKFRKDQASAYPEWVEVLKSLQVIEKRANF